MPTSLPPQADDKIKILLVDDEPANLLALEAILDPLGETLVRARSGEEALRFMANEDYAVVLLDVQMPGFDGFATAKIIRGRPRSRQTPLIFLTAYESDRFPVVEAYKLGAVDYLIKPIIAEILSAKVAVFVDLFRKTQLAQRQVEELQARDRRDVERQRMANALRESESRHRQLADNLPAGFIYQIVENAEGASRFSYVSGGVEALFGVTPAEISSNPHLLYQMIVPEDLPRMREREEESRRQRIRYDCQFRVRARDGCVRWIHCRSAPRSVPEGGYVWDGIAVDITERVEASSALQRSEESLRDANRRKDDFLAMLAHELRNPLAPIRTSLHILGLGGNDARTVDNVRTMMERQVQHLARIVDDLLDVSRITRGKITLRKSRLDLARFVRVSADDHRRAFDTRKVHLQLNVAHQPIWVSADSTRLAQILDNLLTNALKFTNEGGEVEVKTAVDDTLGLAFLSVRDSGIGIEPSVLPYLFGAFTQGDQSLDRSQGGLGLGLAIVKGLVEMHGGTVRAKSLGTGHGSTFTISLRLDHESPVAVDGPVVSAKSVQRLRVLVVEDNRDTAESLRLLLELSGYQVTVAHTGTEGVEAARRTLPEVVLCDIGLPGMDGFAVARTLRSQTDPTAAKLIAVSGYGREEDRKMALEAGFDLHLTKPVDPQKLLAELVKM